VKPSQAGIVDFFGQVAVGLAAAAGGLRHPGAHGGAHRVSTRCWRWPSPEHRGREGLQRRPRRRQAVLADGRLALLAGNDDELFDQLARGAAGGITASAHVATAAFVALHRLLAGQQPAGRAERCGGGWRP
jgi:4-hydroxy-tetrahydrodipicolinate synthase